MPATSTTLLRLLDRPTLQAPGSLVAFSPERRYQLLALLGLRAGQRVERDHIAQILWSHHELKEARRTLRKVTFRAREVRGAQDLQVDDHTLWWPVASDVHSFEEALREGRRAEACWRL